MTTIYNAYPDNMMIYFLEDTRDEIKKHLILSLIYDTNKVAYNRPKNVTIPRSMYEEDKHNTTDKLSKELKRKFIKGLLR